jgi:hypothetical protein
MNTEKIRILASLLIEFKEDLIPMERVVDYVVNNFKDRDHNCPCGSRGVDI